MYSLRDLHELFENYWPNALPSHLGTLYAPARYLMELGGKRLRPVLLLASCEALHGQTTDALPAAAAIEFFHNFTLMHDDIMDNAPTRRSKPTVHTHYNLNTAVLSGDALFAQAYKLLLIKEDNDITTLLRVFTKTAIEVCEGQQMDMDLETAENLSVNDYMMMIEKKTAVLPAAALQMGAIIAGADVFLQNELYNFGLNMGLAFQLKDDVLDVYGNQARVGKKSGGDIVRNKKTILLTLALNANNQLKESLIPWLQFKGPDDEKIKGVKDLYDKWNVIAEATALENEYHSIAMNSLERLPIAEDQKVVLYEIAEMLLGRES